MRFSLLRILSVFVVVLALASSVLLFVHRETGCPFMPSETTPCVMSVVEQLGSLQRLTQAELPGMAALAIVFAPLLALGVFAVSAPAFSVRLARAVSPYQRTLYALLLADGVMHGKYH